MDSKWRPKSQTSHLVLPDHLAKPKMDLTPKFGANIVKKDDSSVSNVDDDVDGL